MWNHLCQNYFHPVLFYTTLFKQGEYGGKNVNFIPYLLILRLNAALLWFDAPSNTNTEFGPGNGFINGITTPTMNLMNSADFVLTSNIFYFMTPAGFLADNIPYRVPLENK